MNKQERRKALREAKAKLVSEVSMQLKEMARLHGFYVKLLDEGRHCRIFGKVQVDFWPATGRAWIVGSTKSFQVSSLEELMKVAEKEIWPSKVTFNKAMNPELLAEYFKPSELCVCCGAELENYLKMHEEREASRQPLVLDKPCRLDIF